MTPDSPPDDFDLVLRKLARPVQPDAELIRKGEAQATHALAGEVARSLRQAALPSAPKAGDILDGRYKVLGVLGRGGMGVVLEAEHLRSNKVVAIKWMSGARDDEHSPVRIARFLREARVVANIQHPNVVDLHDVGDSEGIPFLVLERLRGESLRARLERGPMQWDEAKAIMLGVLQGVGAVHRAGIVHRDLKPDNIFLCEHGQGIVPKVLDFGVAAIRLSSQEGNDSLTRTGALLGTPSYMPLEQLTGGEVDARADIYALGVVLFEMLTGHLPFDARTAADLAVMQATRAPSLPADVVRLVGKARAQIVLRALARNPAQRFADVPELKAVLQGTRRTPWQSRPLLWIMSAATAGAFWWYGTASRPLASNEHQPTPSTAPMAHTAIAPATIAPTVPFVPESTAPSEPLRDVTPPPVADEPKVRTSLRARRGPPGEQTAPSAVREQQTGPSIRPEATRIRLDDF